MIGIDADLTSLEFARHNAAACAPGADVALVCADVSQLPLTGLGAVFIDPARRDGQRRLPPGQYRPPLAWCLRLADAIPLVGIKAAPGLDRDVVPPGWETEFVAVGRELKEALLWSPALATAGTATRATVLPTGDSLISSVTDPAGPVPPVPLAPPGEYLLDPSPAVTRAGLVADLARSLGAWQIDPMIAFLSIGRAGADAIRQDAPGTRFGPVAREAIRQTAARPRHRLGRHPAARPGWRRGPDPAAPWPARRGRGHDRTDQGR